MVKLPWLLRRGKLKKVEVNLGMVKGEVEVNQADREAAWELHVELESRSATQELKGEGSEQRALESLVELFGITREVLKRHGVSCADTGQIALEVLNQVIRPLTTKWHRTGNYTVNSEGQVTAFREELKATQKVLRKYSDQLALIAKG